MRRREGTGLAGSHGRMATNAAPRPERTSASPAERRRFPRVKVMSRLRGYWVDLDLNVTIRDVSVGGFSVLSPMPFSIGAEQSFLLSTIDGRETLTFATCRHCTRTADTGPAMYFAGLQFLPQPADNLTLVIETLRAIESRDKGQRSPKS